MVDGGILTRPSCVKTKERELFSKNAGNFTFPVTLVVKRIFRVITLSSETFLKVSSVKEFLSEVMVRDDTNSI